MLIFQGVTCSFPHVTPLPTLPKWLKGAMQAILKLIKPQQNISRLKSWDHLPDETGNFRLAPMPTTGNEAEHLGG